MVSNLVPSQSLLKFLEINTKGRAHMKNIVFKVLFFRAFLCWGKSYAQKAGIFKENNVTLIELS